MLSSMRAVAVTSSCTLTRWRNYFSIFGLDAFEGWEHRLWCITLLLFCAARSAQEPVCRTGHRPIFRVRSPEGSDFLGTWAPYALRRFLAINSSRSAFRYFT